MNKLLVEENELLQKQVLKLAYDNGNLRQHLPKSSVADAHIKSAVAITYPEQSMVPRHPPNDASPAVLLSIAEETKKEFLSKAIGTAIEWVQMPGMKPGPESIGIITISHHCTGVAARVCNLVGLEPSKVEVVLKDRPFWLHNCRCLDIVNAFPTGNGGTIELLYMQLYAPTTLASARDFWTLRYTSVWEDGSVVVCERSLTTCQGGPSMPSLQNFVRADMLPSGYLIRPCQGGGSVIHIVDHIDFKLCTVPEALHPLYESSTILAQTMTIQGLHSLCHIAQELSGEIVPSWGRTPAAIQILRMRLNRGFNVGVNSLSDDGWTLMDSDGMEDVSISVNVSPTKLLGSAFSSAKGIQSLGLCIMSAKATMLLQNVTPTLLIQFLHDHRSEWADSSIEIYSAANLKTSPYKLSSSQLECFGASQFIPPLLHTVKHEEFIEIIRFENHGLTQEEAVISRDMVLLQLCSGIDEKTSSACAQLIFSPIDILLSDDTPLLASGFRVITLDLERDIYDSDPTLDLASALEVGSAGTQISVHNRSKSLSSKSVLTIAFQFICEKDLQDSVAAMARQYVRSVIAFVQKACMAFAHQLNPNLRLGPCPGIPEPLTLARWICRSHSLYLGFELLKAEFEGCESMLKLLWHHSDVIVCCYWKPPQLFTFANQSGFNMLETTTVALQDLSLEKIIDENAKNNLGTYFMQIEEQGYSYLPSGICLSSMGRPVSYEQATAWKVLDDDDNAHCVAFMFMSWCFA